MFCAGVLLAQVLVEQNRLYNFAEIFLHTKLIYSKKSTIVQILATMQRPRGSIGLQWCEKRL